MPHLNVLNTVHTPVTAVGREIRNSFGVTIATATDTWVASAMAHLINLGINPATKEEEAYEERQRKLAAILFHKSAAL